MLDTLAKEKKGAFRNGKMVGPEWSLMVIWDSNHSTLIINCTKTKYWNILLWQVAPLATPPNVETAEKIRSISTNNKKNYCSNQHSVIHIQETGFKL